MRCSSWTPADLVGPLCHCSGLMTSRLIQIPLVVVATQAFVVDHAVVVFLALACVACTAACVVCVVGGAAAVVGVVGVVGACSVSVYSAAFAVALWEDPGLPASCCETCFDYTDLGDDDQTEAADSSVDRSTLDYNRTAGSMRADTAGKDQPEQSKDPLEGQGMDQRGRG